MVQNPYKCHRTIKILRVYMILGDAVSILESVNKWTPKLSVVLSNSLTARLSLREFSP